MKECREFEPLIDRAHSGEASEEEREKLLDHIESCPACNGAFAAVGSLRSDDLYPEPEEGELLSMRRAVIRQLRHEPETGRLRDRVGLASFLMKPASVAVLTFAVLALGIFLGSRFRGSEREPDGQDRFMTAIKTVARSHAAYEDIVSSPFTYSNVRLTEGTAGLVNLTFDVSRHLELSLKRDDPLVTEVLVQSLIEPSGVDTRLNAISIAENTRDRKIRKSLIVAMLGDENLAVRMAAQSKLVERPGDPEVVDSLLDVLEREQSVRMRLVAIDYLANSNIQPARLERAIAAGEKEGIGAVQAKASGYLGRGERK